jgi:hypothetical protein
MIVTDGDLRFWTRRSAWRQRDLAVCDFARQRRRRTPKIGGVQVHYQLTSRYDGVKCWLHSPARYSNSDDGHHQLAAALHLQTS